MCLNCGERYDINDHDSYTQLQMQPGKKIKPFSCFNFTAGYCKLFI